MLDGIECTSVITSDVVLLFSDRRHVESAVHDGIVTL